jgi:hypothetical protein
MLTTIQFFATKTMAYFGLADESESSRPKLFNWFRQPVRSIQQGRAGVAVDVLSAGLGN